MRLWHGLGERLPRLVRLVGLLWIGTLVLQVSDQTFFGDAGLKALQAQQLARGHLTLSLDLGEPAFARGPFRDGFFPFEKPFVYKIDDRFFSVFPIAFQALTAPFVALLGFRGLYVWPLLGLWITWLATDRLALSCQLPPAGRATALALLVFCSPLSLYGALYWEHTLAVALVTVGWAILVPARSRAGALRVAPSLAAGLAFGSAVWLREESLLLVAMVGLLSLGSLFAAGPTWRAQTALLSGLAVPVVLWLAFNHFAYGAVTGLRALQLDAAQVPAWDLGLARARFFALARLFVTYFPPALLLASLVIAPGALRSLVPLRGPLLASLAFLCLLPLGLPNEGGKQWGPRYLLPLVPVVAVGVATLVGDALRRSPRRWGPILAVTVTVLAVPGVRLNLVEGSQAILDNSRARAEPLRRVRADPRSIVIVSHQFTSQQFVGAFAEKTFFLASTGRGLKRLAEHLEAHAQREFLYLCDPVYPCPVALDSLPNRADLAGEYGSSVVTLNKLGDWRRYVAYVGKTELR